MGTYLLAALLSELPMVSLFGSYRRQFGVLTHLCYAAAFLVVAVHLRGGDQARRLLLAIVLGSLVPSLYAVVQKLGMDPIPWAMDNSRRVVGTLGQPTYLGAYLATVIPVSLHMLLGGWGWKSTKTGKDAEGWRLGGRVFAARGLGWVGLAVLLGLQVAALLFSQSRAAWVGALVGCGVVLLLAQGVRPLLAGLGIGRLAALVVLALAALVAINLPGTEANRLARSVPYLDRMASLADFESGSGRVRALIWQVVPSLVAEKPILGHGPEMMGYAFERYYPPELAYAESRTASADAAHNVLMQLLVSTGVVGLGAFVWVVAAAVRGLTSPPAPLPRGEGRRSPFPGREGGRGVRSIAVPVLGGIAAGLEAYREASRLDPALVLVRINLGELYLRLGRQEEAVGEYMAAVALVPEDAALRARLREIHR